MATEKDVQMRLLFCHLRPERIPDQPKNVEFSRKKVAFGMAEVIILKMTTRITVRMVIPVYPILFQS